jgi:predicted nucleic acid-binding protein
MSTSIVLADTNVISEFVKKTPDAQVMQWLQAVELMAISTITLEEAHFGLAWQPNARKLALFNALVDQMHAVYPITPSIALRAGAMRGQFQAQGIVRSTPDMLIAATRHGAPTGAGHAQCARFLGLRSASGEPV